MKTYIVVALGLGLLSTSAFAQDRSVSRQAAPSNRVQQYNYSKSRGTASDVVIDTFDGNRQRPPSTVDGPIIIQNRVPGQVR